MIFRKMLWFYENQPFFETAFFAVETALFPIETAFFFGEFCRFVWTLDAALSNRTPVIGPVAELFQFNSSRNSMNINHWKTIRMIQHDSEVLHEKIGR